jgi:pectin methylesterase-like acyl-CoA thioesterase
MPKPSSTAARSGYVFRNCTVTAEPGPTQILLGRPWRDYSTVIFIDTDFKAPLDSRGWLEWGGRLKTSTYAEYNSRGQAGDTSLRVAPSRQLIAAEAAPYATRLFLAGSENWDPEHIP